MVFVRKYVVRHIYIYPDGHESDLRRLYYDTAKEARRMAEIMNGEGHNADWCKTEDDEKTPLDFGSVIGYSGDKLPMTGWRCGYIHGAAQHGHVPVFGTVKEADVEFAKGINLDGSAFSSWHETYRDGYDTGKRGLYDEQPPPPSR
jgi:hypothetical protein